MAHYVYILKSLKDGRYYVGETVQVDQRLAFHNAGLQRSTANRIPFVLVMSETFENRTLALQREKQIKSWKGEQAFRNLINGE